MRGDRRDAVMLNVRVSPQIKELLNGLAEAYQEKLGTKVSQTQVVEMAISDAAKQHSVKRK